jgi:hypothetical protein|eukprot:COSAG01_NODE_242_length_20582_cov_314.397256_2_plen_222_part_00
MCGYDIRTCHCSGSQVLAGGTRAGVGGAGGAGGGGVVPEHWTSTLTDFTTPGQGSCPPFHSLMSATMVQLFLPAQLELTYASALAGSPWHRPAVSAPHLPSGVPMEANDTAVITPPLGPHDRRTSVLPSTPQAQALLPGAKPPHSACGGGGGGGARLRPQRAVTEVAGRGGVTQQTARSLVSCEHGASITARLTHLRPPSSVSKNSSTQPCGPVRLQATGT